MQQDRLGQRGRARITAEEYNHSLSKLVSAKRKVKPSRKSAFMGAFPVKASPSLHSDEKGASVLPLREASITHPEHSTTPNTDETTSEAEVKSPVEVKQKLQVFVRGLLLPKTLCLQLDPETSVSGLKALVESESGIQPQDQHLYIGRNFQLCDLLSIRDHGIQTDQNIELRVGGLLGGGLEEDQLRSRFFLNLSRQLGRKWTKLAIYLGFLEEELDAFEYGRELDQHCFKMLNTWWQKQDNPKGAAEELKDALKATGRTDLALQVHVQGIAGTSFDVTQCARELAAHYRETMKVTTHPTERHMARGMDDIYVTPQLLQETNIPIQVTGSQSMHSTADKEFHVQKIPLDSFEEMLVLKSNRVLVRAEAGYGKTTLLKRIAYDWADITFKRDQTENQQQPESTSVLGRYDLVFVVEVNRMGEKFDIIDAIFSQILTDRKLKEKFKDLEKYILENPERVLILLDGADELSLQRVKDSQCKNGIDLNDVLSFKLLKSCKVIVTSRQKTANELLTMHAYYTKINIVGFDKKKMVQYVRNHLKEFDTDNQISFLDKVFRNETLHRLAEIPLFLRLMCDTCAAERKLPQQITGLFRENIQLLIQHKASKETHEQVSDTKILVSKLGRIALEGLLDPTGERLHFMEEEIDPHDLEIFERGFDVGLLSKREKYQGVKTVSRFSFLHKTFQEYSAAAYLVDLFETDRIAFNQYLSRIFSSDVESLEYLLRFCCGLKTNATEVILKRMADILKQNELNKSVHRISMLLIFEAQSECLLKYFVENVKIEFQYKLQGEVLVAAHYFFQVGSKHRILHKVDTKEIDAECRGLADMPLLEDIMKRIQCEPSLNLKLHFVRWDVFEDNSKEILKYLKYLDVNHCNWSLAKLFQVLSKSKTQEVRILGFDLHDALSKQSIEPVPSLQKCCFAYCGLTHSDIEPLFSLLSSAGSIKEVVLGGDNLHGLQPVKIASVPSLKELRLAYCGLTKSDIKPLFSLLSSAGNINMVVLRGNNLHGLQHVSIASVPTLKELYLEESGLTESDIKPLFSLLSSAGNIDKVVLRGNNLHGLQPVMIAGVPSLKELHLSRSCLTNSDIAPLVSILSSAGSIQRLSLSGNDLHGLEHVTLASIPSLEDLDLVENGLTNSDIEPLFSILSSAGSIRRLCLKGNNLHGLEHVTLASIPSLEGLDLIESGLTNSDIGPLFSLLSSAGSIKNVLLKGNNLNGLEHVTIDSVPSLEELCLFESGLTNRDFEPLFSLLSSAGSIKKFVVEGNIWQGLLQPVKITSVTSIEELCFYKSGMTSRDIEPLFSLLSSAGSIKIVHLKGDNLHGLQPVKIASVPSLKELHIHESGLTSSDVEPLFSLLSSAGNIKLVHLRGNNLHGLQPFTIAGVPSLEELQLIESGLTSTDIEPLFSLLSSARSLNAVYLNGNNFHSLPFVTVPFIPSLHLVGLSECGLQPSDIVQINWFLSSLGEVTYADFRGNNLHGNDATTLAVLLTMMLNCSPQFDEPLSF